MIRGISEDGRGRDNKRLLFLVLSGILAKKCGMCCASALVRTAKGSSVQMPKMPPLHFL